MSDEQPKEFFARLLRGERKSETTAEEAEEQAQEGPQRAVDPSQGLISEEPFVKSPGELLFRATHPPR